MKQATQLIILAIIIMLAYTPAQAADGNGIVNAVSYRDLPTGASITVQALDNSDQSITLINELETALKQRGYALSTDGALILTVEYHDEIGGWQSVDRRHIVELSTQQSTSNDDSTNVKLNLFNSNTGGILNKGENSGTTIVTPSQYEITMTLENASDGKRLWEGWARADVGRASNESLRRRMVPALADVLGKTINHSALKTQ
ncbi:MAG: hypothetical protein HON65_07950 [Rhodospirillales bacterium]|nr:hypothetical protein [Rhodospirillales bacterium]